MSDMVAALCVYSGQTTRSCNTPDQTQPKIVSAMQSAHCAPQRHTNNTGYDCIATDPSLYVDGETVYITHYRINASLPKPAGGYRFAVFMKLPASYFSE